MSGMETIKGKFQGLIDVLMPWEDVEVEEHKDAAAEKSQQQAVAKPARAAAQEYKVSGGDSIYVERTEAQEPAPSFRTRTRAQHPQHGVAGLGVQRAGRLVGQDQRPVADHGTRDRHPLRLPTGHLVGEPVGQLREPDIVERRQRGPAGGRPGDAVQLRRQAHVLRRGQRRDQVEVLEHVAHPAPAHRRQLRGTRAPQVHPLDPDRPAGGSVQTARDRQQAGLPRPGRTHHRHQLPGADPQRDAAQGVHLHRRAAEHLVDVHQFQHDAHRDTPVSEASGVREASGVPRPAGVLRPAGDVPARPSAGWPIRPATRTTLVSQ